MLTVFTGLKNKSETALPIEVETVYKDKADQPLSDGRAGWIGITLKPHEETQYRSRGPLGGCHRFHGPHPPRTGGGGSLIDWGAVFFGPEVSLPSKVVLE